MTVPRVGEGMQELEFSHPTGGDVKWYQLFGKWFPKESITYLSDGPAIPPLSIYSPKRNEEYVRPNTCA